MERFEAGKKYIALEKGTGSPARMENGDFDIIEVQWAGEPRQSWSNSDEMVQPLGFTSHHEASGEIGEFIISMWAEATPMLVAEAEGRKDIFLVEKMEELESQVAKLEHRLSLVEKRYHFGGPLIAGGGTVTVNH
jgi:hypothetical protein